MAEKDYTFTGYNKAILENAKELRKNMTPQEGKLWHIYLKNYSVKFYRQRIIDNYIVDFYCSKAKLAIEIDGCQHYSKNGVGQDKYRTEILKKYGIKVLRFSNADVDTNIYGVCEAIDTEVKKRLINGL